MAGTLTIGGLAAGLPAGEEVIGPITITGTTAITALTGYVLASGDTTITIPTGAVAALLVAPTNGTATLKVRTSQNSGDAGLPICAAGLPMVYPLPQPLPSSLIVNSGATQVAPMTVGFI